MPLAPQWSSLIQPDQVMVLSSAETKLAIESTRASIANTGITFRIESSWLTGVPPHGGYFRTCGRKAPMEIRWGVGIGLGGITPQAEFAQYQPLLLMKVRARPKLCPEITGCLARHKARAL